MGLVCFKMARVNHLHPSGVGLIIAGIVFSSFRKVNKNKEREERGKAERGRYFPMQGRD
jgi:hypothetical protein